MPTCFIDTSALVKLYAREPGTDAMLELVSREGWSCALLALTRLECRGALRRRQRSGDYPREHVNTLVERLERDLAEFFLVQPLDNGVLALAEELIDRHPLRANDAAQLAGGLQVRRAAGDETVLFVASDRTLSAAARAEGLAVFDPNQPEPPP